MRVEPEAFIDELHKLYQASKSAGSVQLTIKKFRGVPDEKSRNNNAPNDAGGTFPPLFFDAQNDDFFKSAQRVSCHARVVPLINRVPRFFPPRQPRARRKRKLTHRVSIPSPIYQQTRREGKRKSEKERTRRPPRPG